MIINNKYDIFTISESWLDSTICDADILIPGYTTFRQDRGLHKRGGGLLVYVNVLILGDLKCNVLGTTDPGCRALINFCSTFGLTQLVKTATRVTENSESLIGVALTTNENIIYACDVLQSAISDHILVSLTLKFKTPSPRNTFVTTRTYKNYDRNGFIDDLANVPFHIANLFDDPDDQVNAFNCLFLQVLDEHALIKRIRINSRPNPFITPEIKFKARPNESNMLMQHHPTLLNPTCCTRLATMLHDVA